MIDIDYFCNIPCEDSRTSRADTSGRYSVPGEWFLVLDSPEQVEPENTRKTVLVKVKPGNHNNNKQQTYPPKYTLYLVFSKTLIAFVYLKIFTPLQVVFDERDAETVEWMMKRFQHIAVHPSLKQNKNKCFHLTNLQYAVTAQWFKHSWDV